MGIYQDTPDDILKQIRKDKQHELREVEWEIHFRREQKYRAPHWYCTHCQTSFRTESRFCPECGREAEPFQQAAIALDILAEERNG